MNTAPFLVVCPVLVVKLLDDREPVLETEPDQRNKGYRATTVGE
jgi:hypothetical protein